MKAAPDDFKELRALLALKRHEQPPPGYFDQLPGKIIARIEAGTVRPRSWDGFWSRLILKPATAYGFGLAVCGVLAVVIGLSWNSEAEVGLASPSDDAWHLNGAGLPLLSDAQAMPAPQDFNTIVEGSSTNPIIIHSQPLLFDNPVLRVEPASFNR